MRAAPGPWLIVHDVLLRVFDEPAAALSVLRLMTSNCIVSLYNADKVLRKPLSFSRSAAGDEQTIQVAMKYLPILNLISLHLHWGPYDFLFVRQRFVKTRATGPHAARTQFANLDVRKGGKRYEDQGPPNRNHYITNSH